MNDLEDLDDQLNRTLREHADGVHGAPLAFDDVRGRATSIRRRRRLAGGLGVAAAIAVIVPTAMFATNSNDGHRHEHPVPDLHACHGLRPARARRHRLADGCAAGRPAGHRR